MAYMNAFGINDEVVNKNDEIGRIIRVTPTGRLVVEFESGYRKSFRSDGNICNNDVWSYDRIYPLTDATRKRIDDDRTVRKCQSRLRTAKLTPEQARKILEILSDDAEKGEQ